MKNKKNIYSLIALIICFNLLVTPAIAHASDDENKVEFNKNFIISDEEMTDYESMTTQEIADFLQEKDGYLADYVDPKIRMMIPNFISLVSSLNRINPKYILTVLQKEQGLITDKSPKQSQLDWATGYGCPDGQACERKYKGLANQIDWGIGGMRYYLDHPNEFTYQVGGSYTIDGERVTMLNDSTRALYTYTPHIHGNELFFNIWNKWFGVDGNTPQVDNPTEDPEPEVINYFYKDGMVVYDSENDEFWLIQDNTKRKFATKATFLSRSNVEKAVIAKAEELAKYEVGTEIKYPNYSLLRDPEKNIYLVVDDSLRMIEDNEAFKLIGFNPEEIIDVPVADIESYNTGEPITVASAYPTGALLQDKASGGIYFVQNGKKYPIWDRTLIKLYYNNIEVTPASSDELAKYLTQKPIKLKDGELVKVEGDSRIYLISGGKRMTIADENTFNELGFKWSNIKQISKKILNLHTPSGQIQVE